MGLSASQARFLQLTARRSNVEYQAQQINFQRLQWSDKLAAASSEYQDKTSNRKMVYNFNNGDGITQVDVTYQNYKNYMNQQMEGLTTAQDKFFLVSSTGNKIIVASEEERDKMIEQYTTYTPYTASSTENSVDENGETPEIVVREDEQGNSIQNLVHREFSADDFMIVDNLDDVDNFQSAIENGIYFFAKRELNTETNMYEFRTESWDSIGGGAIGEVYDTTDDAQAEAEFKATSDKIQNIDKKLELQLNQLETERSAIQTEIESISKVLDDNVESSFKTFS